MEGEVSNQKIKKNTGGKPELHCGEMSPSLLNTEINLSNMPGGTY